MMSFVRAMQTQADTSPASLSPINGLREGHSAVLCSLPEVAPRVLQALLMAGACTGPLFVRIKDLFMHHCVLGEVE